MYVDMTSQTQQAEKNGGISPGNKDITETWQERSLIIVGGIK